MYNYHDAGKAKLVGDFINDVLAYTGKSKVDIIGHSMGVTVGLHALEKGDLGKKLRRFISIGGAMTGLGACLAFGPANPYGPACGSQNWFLGDVFGVHPHSVFSPNRRLSLSGFVATPSRLTDAEFYSIRAGMNDEFLCATNSFYQGCDLTATFLARSNVKSQVNVGWGSTTIEVDYDLKDYSLFKAGGGDLDGVGHFRSKNNTGPIQVKMLSTTCSGAGCCNSYTAPCSAL
jgi:pimeloyl-ACP methyl ester carboxylesterase